MTQPRPAAPAAQAPLTRRRLPRRSRWRAALAHAVSVAAGAAAWQVIGLPFQQRGLCAR